MSEKRTDDGIDTWVKISVIVQGIIMVLVCALTSLQYKLNRRAEEQAILEKSFKIKQEAAEIIFHDDPNGLKKAQIRNILEWIEEEPK
jgi:hypothetical protein